MKNILIFKILFFLYYLNNSLASTDTFSYQNIQNKFLETFKQINNNYKNNKLLYGLVGGIFAPYAIKEIYKYFYKGRFCPIKIKGEITFKNIGGMKRLKEEFSDTVKILKNPKKFKNLKIKPPKGYVFYGFPGTGKTFFAKAIAAEAGVPFYLIKQSDINNAGDIKILFKEARKKAPCVIYFDEIDGLIKNRLYDGRNVENGILEAFLSELSGFIENTNVLVIGSTNHLRLIDEAALRAGRLERHIEFSYPNKEDRIEIIKIFLDKTGRKLKEPLNLEFFAQKTGGLTAAEIEDIINRAIYIAYKKEGDIVYIKEYQLNDAWEEQQLGLKKDIGMSEEDLKKIAIHECGHAILQMQKGFPFVFDRVTAVSHVGSLGITIGIERGDYTDWTERAFISVIKSALAGRIAEEIFYQGERTAGASSDLSTASRVAIQMVMRYGMGKRIFTTADYLQEPKEYQIEEAENILQRCYQETKFYLIKHKILLKMLAEKLMKKKTLFKVDVEEVIVEYEKLTGNKVL
jgi:ATP-dependent Zn protease